MPDAYQFPCTAETLRHIANDIAERRLAPAETQALRPLAQRLIAEIDRAAGLDGHGRLEPDLAPYAAERWTEADY